MFKIACDVTLQWHWIIPYLQLTVAHTCVDRKVALCRLLEAAPVLFAKIPVSLEIFSVQKDVAYDTRV